MYNPNNYNPSGLYNPNNVPLAGTSKPSQSTKVPVTTAPSTPLPPTTSTPVLYDPNTYIPPGLYNPQGIPIVDTTLVAPTTKVPVTVVPSTPSTSTPVLYDPNTYNPPGLYNPQNIPIVSTKPTTPSTPSTSIPENSTPIKFTPMNTKIMFNGKEYDTYRGNDGAYYYIIDGTYVKATDTEAKVIAQNKNVSFLGDNKFSSKPSTEESKKEENWADKAPDASTGGGLSDALLNQLFDKINKLDEDNAKLREELNKPPEKHGAQFWADKIGLDYDLDAILQEYNDRTNTFYNELNANAELLRNNYIRNTGLYNENLINNYIDSYKNAAQTATNKRATAASALAMLINQNNQNNLMEYDMANEVEANKVAQRTALAQHPYEAEDYYNKIGTYLSGIEGLANTEDVKNYVNQLDAYSSKYAATQNARATGYLAKAEKYAGLANATKTTAANTADAYTNNKLQQMWDLYYGLTGSNVKASTAIKNLTSGSVGIAG